MHSVTVACRSCGKDFTYRTMFMTTVGIATCPYCGTRDRGEAPVDDKRSSRHNGEHDTGLTAASRTEGST